MPQSYAIYLVCLLSAFLFGILTIWPLYALIGDEAAREWLLQKLDLGYNEAGFFICYFACLAVIWFLIVRKVWQLLHGKHLLDRGSATSIAKIADRRMVKESGCLSLLMGVIPTGHTDYYVAFEFDAAQATKTSGIVRLEARVSKGIYERLVPGTTANVRYATQNPRVVLLEGE